MVPRTILVPYDGSDGADAMLNLACVLSNSEDSRIVALSVTQVHRALPLENLPPVFDEPGRRALVRAQDLASRHGMKIDLRLRHSYDATTTVLREARVVGADLILVGLRRPRHWWLHLGLGGSARAIGQRAPCPVLIGYFPPVPELEPSEVVHEAQRLLRRLG